MAVICILHAAGVYTFEETRKINFVNLERFVVNHIDMLAVKHVSSMLKMNHHILVMSLKYVFHYPILFIRKVPLVSAFAFGIYIVSFQGCDLTLNIFDVV